MTRKIIAKSLQSFTKGLNYKTKRKETFYVLIKMNLFKGISLSFSTVACRKTDSADNMEKNC